MSDTPKFTVVDRRKLRDDDSATESTPVSPAEPPVVSSTPVSEETATRTASAGPRLVTATERSAPPPPPTELPVTVVDEPEDADPEEDEANLPPVPTAEESSFQKIAYQQAAERLDDLVRAQNPGAPAAEKIGFEHLVQQLYLSAMMQMGAGTPEGQRPRIDILGARQTIDLLDVVQDKTAGSLSAQELRTLETVLYELRATFLELTRMISMQTPQVPPPGAPKR